MLGVGPWEIRFARCHLRSRRRSALSLVSMVRNPYTICWRGLLWRVCSVGVGCKGQATSVWVGCLLCICVSWIWGSVVKVAVVKQLFTDLALLGASLVGFAVLASECGPSGGTWLGS